MREIDADIDWDHWRKADLWELEKACKLVYPKDPYSYKTKSSTPHRGRMPAHQDILNPDPRSRPAWANLYHLALDAVHAETLPYVLVKRGLYKLRSAEFLAWAQTKGVTIPPELAGIPSPRTAGWPWGDYETDLLRHLAAAAVQFWKDYDPSKPTTAPTNKAVAGWLEDKGVLPRNAKSIATILRAKGLPTGPRKKKSPRTQ